MKRILIPTDFTIKSLNIITRVVDMYSDEQLSIVLFHVLKLPFNIRELLFASTRNQHYELVTDEFRDTCEMLKNKYRNQINTITVKFSIGDSRSYVRDVIDAEGIDEICVDDDVKLTKASDRSVDMMKLLPHARVHINHVSANYVQELSETGRKNFRLEQLIKSYN